MDTINNGLWKEISNMFTDSSKKIKLNINETTNGKNTLEVLQITSKSALGSIVYNTSGIIVDDWIRILGSDSEKNRGILSYNLVNKDGVATKIDKMLIVADDIVGGVFALNTGKFSIGVGDIWYFAPDTLEWESLDMKYSEFITWIAQGNMNEFYSTLRWNTWKEDSEIVKFDEAILIYSFLWSNELQLEKADKKIVPAKELLNINQEYSKKFNLS
ncbi:hypothetical protein COM13_25595 [Bacillus pseudomycoides]|uniref:DUF2625 family protein n=1 Tax=Bacillus pseudomycoides TaxID=64104 RepID=UPI000BEE354B|nr:DUF2625 family protein [Bacillus pseudomycoides]PDY02294.1 hypothetical protein COO07_01745 [Bacillus pseudomycoides]PEK78799.1 hypothetical protein CN597_15645 [Bacillus pseudomycoides]PEN07213.1 hypothetical protein CN640_15540 [Bacillus pseudomycoides]PGB79431.1 hypothetical protein COM13_25595 [Bacillus pseudomycoides]PHE53729.1 hypothetical protein COF52_24040 [Bacillus pseudomycoides]